MTICISSWSLTSLATPLETTTPDPLLPTVERPITSFERNRIQRTIIELDNQAQAKLQAGLVEEAFSLWYRELRLQRALGLTEEIPALGRVGAIAWEENRPQDTAIIGDRLDAIAETLGNDITLKESLAQAYQQLRSWEKAIIFYEEVLLYRQQENNLTAQQEILENLGRLYLGIFDYTNANRVYTELLEIARLQHDSIQTTVYLQKLAEISNEISKPENSIAIKEQLVTQYTENEQLTELATLKISLGLDYQAINQIEDASRNYEEAFTIARSQQQYSLATEAKSQQASLYYKAGQLDQALDIYQQLIELYQQSYNLYDLMNTYDQIGKIYSEQNKYNEALEAYTKGLELAESLDTEQAYFNEQITQIRAKIDQL